MSALSPFQKATRNIETAKSNTKKLVKVTNKNNSAKSSQSKESPYQKATRNIETAKSNTKKLIVKKTEEKPNFSSIEGGARKVNPDGEPSNFTPAPVKKSIVSTQERENFSNLNGEKQQVPPPQAKKTIVQKYENPPNPLQREFYTLQGQKKAFTNVKETYKALVKGEGVKSNLGKEGSTTRAITEAVVPDNLSELAFTAIPIGKAGSVVSKGIKARKGVQVAKTTSKAKAKGIKEFAKRQKLLERAEQATVGYSVSENVARAGVKGSKETRKELALKEEEIDLLFNQAMRESTQATSLSDAIITSLPAGTAINPSARNRAEKLIREELNRRGVGGKEADKIIKQYKKENKIIASGEAGAALTAAATGEVVGRTGTTVALQKAGKTTREKLFGEVFKRTAPPIAIAGAIEGGIGVKTQNTARKEKTTLQEAIIGAGAGAATAGILGGTIAGLKATGGKSGDALNILANIIDPLEAPGDLVATGATKAASKISKTPIITPSIIQSRRPEDMVIFGEGKKRGKTPRKKTSSVKPITENIIYQTNEQKKPRKRSAPVSNPTKKRTPNQVPNKKNSTTNSNSRNNTGKNTNQNTKQKENVNTLTNIPILTNTPIPVVTPQPRIPPAPPITLGGGTGNSTGKGRGRRNFVNELDIALGSIGINQRPKQQQERKKQKQKIKQRKKTKQTISKLNKQLFGIS